MRARTPRDGRSVRFRELLASSSPPGARGLRPRGHAIDVAIAGGVATLYLVLSAALLPPAEVPRALGLGLGLFAGVAALGRRFGRGIAGWGAFAVGILAAVVLWLPTFPALGGRSDAAIRLGFLGMQAAMLLWAAVSWEVPAERPSHVPLAQALLAGAFLALLLSALATIGVTLQFIAAGRKALPLLLVFPAYFAGTLMAASLFWLLQRIAHLGTGRYLIGFLGGICLYGAVTPIVMILKHDPIRAGPMLAIAAIAGGLVGPAVALQE